MFQSLCPNYNPRIAAILAALLCVSPGVGAQSAVSHVRSLSRESQVFEAPSQGIGVAETLLRQGWWRFADRLGLIGIAAAHERSPWKPPTALSAVDAPSGGVIDAVRYQPTSVSRSSGLPVPTLLETIPARSDTVSNVSEPRMLMARIGHKPGRDQLILSFGSFANDVADPGR